MMKNTRNIARKYGARLGAGIAVGMACATNAFADATAASTQIGASTGDVQTIGWASLGVLIAAAAFKYMRRTV